MFLLIAIYFDNASHFRLANAGLYWALIFYVFFGVLQFVRQPGSQNSEKSRAAKIPTEASVCPTKKKNALAASIFFIFAVKTWHNM